LIQQCAILLGGLGTRLGNLAKVLPKPLLPVGGVPFVEVLIAEARRRGLGEFLLLAGHCSEAVAAFVEERQIAIRYECSVTISVEPAPYGTGGALVHALPLLKDEFLLLNGDTWFDFNWLDLVVRSRREGAAMGLSLREILRPERYETVDLNNGRVMAIRARGENCERGLINGGVYYLTRHALEGLKYPSSLETDLLPRLAESHSLHGYCYSGFFIDIGIPESLIAADEAVPAHRRRPAAFLDRDGVLNVDHGYVHAPEQFEWLKGAKETVKALNDTGYYVFVVTNQAGVAKGFYEEAAIGLLHRWMSTELAKTGASIDDWRYCPYHQEASVRKYRGEHHWRKPNPGMIEDLLARWPVERCGSFLIGDKDTDIQAANAAGITGHLFQGGDVLDFLHARGLPAVQAHRVETTGMTF
jgi:D-glycero-D-manno-heptose 1,7-bisphosphate phosphatase